MQLLILVNKAITLMITMTMRKMVIMLMLLMVIMELLMKVQNNTAREINETKFSALKYSSLPLFLPSSSPFCVAGTNAKAEPSVPMRPDVATLHLHMKNSGYRGNSVTNPRYVASQAPPKIQNTENEYLELGKPSDEVYEEIPDSTLPDLKQVNPTPPIPRSPNPDVNNQSGAQRNDSNIRPISQSGLSPLRLSEISNKSTYLDLLG
ncbi:hypothetical protein LSH36_113g00000 [Paralvinella palmiformis]|uniref:Uncharacterized protein n=1 Tax=Paralvinella palmiformis TaxID=53620 RepID=A0AAD9N9A1_9ANNE|nr:hypothetical protein LSH36_113g00000 [Paralvinella palmiformis]